MKKKKSVMGAQYSAPTNEQSEETAKQLMNRTVASPCDLEPMDTVDGRQYPSYKEFYKKEDPSLLERFPTAESGVCLIKLPSRPTEGPCGSMSGKVGSWFVDRNHGGPAQELSEAGCEGRAKQWASFCYGHEERVDSKVIPSYGEESWRPFYEETRKPHYESIRRQRTCLQRLPGIMEDTVSPWPNGNNHWGYPGGAADTDAKCDTAIDKVRQMCGVGSDNKKIRSCDGLTLPELKENPHCYTIARKATSLKKVVKRNGDEVWYPFNDAIDPAGEKRDFTMTGPLPLSEQIGQKPGQFNSTPYCTKAKGFLKKDSKGDWTLIEYDPNQKGGEVPDDLSKIVTSKTSIAIDPLGKNVSDPVGDDKFATYAYALRECLVKGGVVDEAGVGRSYYSCRPSRTYDETADGWRTLGCLLNYKRRDRRRSMVYTPIPGHAKPNPIELMQDTQHLGAADLLKHAQDAHPSVNINPNDWWGKHCKYTT